jgi:hypothetical protein
MSIDEKAFQAVLLHALNDCPAMLSNDDCRGLIEAYEFAKTDQQPTTPAEDLKTIRDALASIPRRSEYSDEDKFWYDFHNWTAKKWVALMLLDAMLKGTAPATLAEADIETLNERETSQALERIQRECLLRSEPYAARLMAFQAARPALVTLPDGQHYQYIGPLPDAPTVKPKQGG